MYLNKFSPFLIAKEKYVLYAFSLFYRSGYGISTAQVVVECERCEGNNNSHWKCLTCHAFLCESCYKKHMEETAFKDHEVKKRSEVYYGAVCQMHGSKYTIMFCKDCFKAVCATCIAKLHQGHALIE